MFFFYILTSGDTIECYRISGALLLQGIFLESLKHKARAINSRNTLGNEGLVVLSEHYNKILLAGEIKAKFVTCIP